MRPEWCRWGSLGVGVFLVLLLWFDRAMVGLHMCGFGFVVMGRHVLVSGW